MSPSTCTAHTIITLLHDYWAIHEDSPAPPPLCMPYTIQYWQWQYLVKANPPTSTHNRERQMTYGCARPRRTVGISSLQAGHGLEPRTPRTVVAAPSSVVKCLWEVFVWGVVLVVCVCVCRCRGCCSLSVCVCVCVTC